MLEEREILRAGLDAVCYQTRDLVEAMRRDAGGAIPRLRVDGGMVENRWLLQRMADLTGVTVERLVDEATTAVGDQRCV